MKKLKPKRKYVRRAQIAAELALAPKKKRKYVRRTPLIIPNEPKILPSDQPPWEYSESVLSKAQEIVDGRDKSAHYGPPEHSMQNIALIWSGVLGHIITAEQVALMMLGLKMARLAVDPAHLDGLLDAAGYIRILERIQKAKKKG